MYPLKNVETYESVPATRTLSSWSVGYTVSRPRVKAEKLRTDAIVLEAGGGSTVLAALGIQRQQLARQHPGQRLVLVWAVVHASRSLATEEGK